MGVKESKLKKGIKVNNKIDERLISIFLPLQYSCILD